MDKAPIKCDVCIEHVVNYQLGNVMDDRYIRIQSQLTIASAEIDTVTPKNIECLQQEANAMIEDNQEVIDFAILNYK